MSLCVHVAMCRLGIISLCVHVAICVHRYVFMSLCVHVAICFHRYVVHVAMCRLDVISLLWWFLCEQMFKLQPCVGLKRGRIRYHMDLFIAMS